MEEQAPLYDQFVLFGDSITEFGESQVRGFAWAAALRDSYIRRLEVVNRGLSGYNTDMALRVLSKAIPRLSQGRIRLLTIFFGANDSCFPTEVNNQCVPLPEFRSNLIKIIRSPMVAEHNPGIILITNPPIVERTQRALDALKGYPVRRSAENTRKYADAIRSVGESLGITVCDIWTDIMLRAGWDPESEDPIPGCQEAPENPILDAYLFDGLHLSPLGYKLLYAKLMRLIAQHHPTAHPDSLPFILPRWDDGEGWQRTGEEGAITANRPRFPAATNVAEMLAYCEEELRKAEEGLRVPG